MLPHVSPPLVCIAALAGAACGSARLCSTNCLQIAGPWNLVIDYITVTGECSWFNSTGETSMEVDQLGGGAKVSVSVEEIDLVGGTYPIQTTVVLNGSLTEDDTLSATQPLSLYSDGINNDQRTDTLSLNFSASSDFAGSWVATLVQMDNSGNSPTTCMRAATVHGAKAGP